MLSRFRRTRTARPARLPVARPSSVVLVSRSGCHLCAEAEPVVARTAREAGLPFEVRSVDDDPALRALWTDHVPVVLLDGAEHSRWWVDEAALRTALALGPARPV